MHACDLIFLVRICVCVCRAAAKIEIRVLEQIRAIDDEGRE